MFLQWKNLDGWARMPTLHKVGCLCVNTQTKTVPTHYFKGFLKTSHQILFQTVKCELVGKMLSTASDIFGITSSQFQRSVACGHMPMKILIQTNLIIEAAHNDILEWEQGFPTFL